MIVGNSLVIQAEVFSIALITIVILIILLWFNRAVIKADPLQKPKGLVLLAILYVKLIAKLTKDNMGGKVAHRYAPYIGVLAIYLAISNLSGLFGLSQPTANYSVTLTFALITFFLIQRMSIKSIGLKGYLKSFFEPYPFFFLMNFFGRLAPLISMSIRLFGNITSGVILTTLFYVFTAWLAAFVPYIGVIDFIGPLIAPVLHAYFDVFVGLIQMFIFISLTTVFIGNEIPQEE